jgi:UDP-2,4-diacetamido-2,4,6-trideoxy-beta-L-altropyranose hydrolase
MRCLALAQAWQGSGCRIVYAMASCSAAVADRLRAEEIEISHLGREPGSVQDANATVETAQALGSDWIVLDGYHFDERYVAAIRRSGIKLLLLDDFGALKHYAADIVVNQDPVADSRLYLHRDAMTRLLLGTDYTFLRREFLQRARPDREFPAISLRLLLTFGGSDPEHLTELALTELGSVAVAGLEVVILIAPSNPRAAELEAVARNRSNVRLVRNPPNVPEWMNWCDVAVIAAGSTIWELAYCRVPCIAIAVNEEQLPSMNILHQRGACISLGVGRCLAPGKLAAAIQSLCHDSQRRASLSMNLAAMVDGRGAQRVMAAMQNPGACGA